MAVSTTYAQPVQVNGYSCRNCTDVDNAKKHVDPAHPKSGPYNIDAATDPTRKPAVAFGGALASLNSLQAGAQAQTPATGARVDVTA